MPTADEITLLPPSLAIWQAYDPSVKADLFSTAVLTAGGIYLVDPIALTDPALAELTGTVAGVIVTNGNHWRAAARFAERFSVPVFAGKEALFEEDLPNFKAVSDGDSIGPDLQVIAIDGAAAGEMALLHTPNRGALVVGDALINFEPYGFTFLPAKYCADQKVMRRSLQKLLAHRADRMLFAHGMPILSGASDRLAELLTGDS